MSTQKKRADGEVSAGETNVDFRPHLVVNPSSSVRDQPRFTMSETFIAAGSHQADGKAITPVGQAPEHSEQTIPR